jgi:hypothetical protein
MTVLIFAVCSVAGYLIGKLVITALGVYWHSLGARGP